MAKKKLSVPEKFIEQFLDLATIHSKRMAVLGYKAGLKEGARKAKAKSAAAGER